MKLQRWIEGSFFALLLVAPGCGGGGGGIGTGGLRVVFASNYLSPAQMELYVGTVGSPNPTRITFAAGDDVEPDSAGNFVVFTSTRNGNSEIFRANLDGSNLVRVTNNFSTSLSDGQAHLNSAGNRIVFTRDDGGGQGNIYTIGIDGTGLTQLTFDNKSFYPCWSPDGTRIAFSRQAPSTVELWTMNADGTGQGVVQTDTDSALEPNWRGTMIAFTGERNSSSGVFIVSQTGGTAARLTAKPFQWSPRISPDGTFVIFGANGPLGDNNIYRVAVNNPQVVTLYIDYGAQESAASFTN
jgi:Tol biopolymer transport system component